MMGLGSPCQPAWGSAAQAGSPTTLHTPTPSHRQAFASAAASASAGGTGFAQAVAEVRPLDGACPSCRYCRCLAASWLSPIQQPAPPALIPASPCPAPTHRPWPQAAASAGTTIPICVFAVPQLAQVRVGGGGRSHPAMAGNGSAAVRPSQLPRQPSSPCPRPPPAGPGLCRGPGQGCGRARRQLWAGGWLGLGSWAGSLPAPAQPRTLITIPGAVFLAACLHLPNPVPSSPHLVPSPRRPPACLQLAQSQATAKAAANAFSQGGGQVGGRQGGWVAAGGQASRQPSVAPTGPPPAGFRPGQRPGCGGLGERAREGRCWLSGLGCYPMPATSAFAPPADPPSAARLPAPACRAAKRLRQPTPECNCCERAPTA